MFGEKRRKLLEEQVQALVVRDIAWSGKLRG